MLKIIGAGVCIFVLYKLMVLTDQLDDTMARLCALETQVGGAKTT